MPNCVAMPFSGNRTSIEEISMSVILFPSAMYVDNLLSLN